MGYSRPREVSQFGTYVFLASSTDHFALNSNPSKQFLFMTAMYYRGAAAAIIVYDITRSTSFKTLKHWVEELKSKGPKDIAIAIAGNKSDLENPR